MSILLKIVPDMSSPKYALTQTVLTIPVSYTYEDKNGMFMYDVGGGLPILSKAPLENGIVTYYIGENCSIDQLSSFISNVGKGLQANITFSECDDVVNMIEYDPHEGTWKHITGARMGTAGSTITMKVDTDTARGFRKSLEEFRRFAYMTIEGHKKLAGDNMDMF
jgi:hypothetical protein